MPEYFDFHSHIHFPKFAQDLDEVFARMQEFGVWTTVVGTDLEQSKRAVEFARAHDGVFATVGLHPADNTKESFDPADYNELVADPKVVMVGECGLDYFHVKDPDEQKRQRAEFERQIDFAVLHKKPLMLHIRNAHDDGLDILTSKKREYGDRLQGNAHFFTEGAEVAKRYYEIDFTTSFPGVITFTRDYDDTVRYAPADMIHAETDSPYAAPIPYRGKRNEPAFVVEVVKKMAELRGEDVEVLKKQLIENARRFVPLHS
ncbi:MAG: TatD family hydrolase [Candidatus Pacebacteria bacterium]|nr:TatD family hydrolase [Candidatus Paceibacterota bacterium]